MARSRSRRGEYRAIHTVILDGPDYQALTPNGRLMLLTCKLSLGPCQIGVVPALEWTLHERTGLPLGQVGDALRELEVGGWVERERNVLWVVRGLEFEPSLESKNPNHKTGVRAFVLGLPSLAIVGRFLDRYADTWDLTDLRIPYQQAPVMASPGHVHAMRMVHTDTDTDTDTDSAEHGMSAVECVKTRKTDPGYSPEFLEAYAAYPKRPGNSQAEAWRAWRKSVTRRGADPPAMVAGAKAYAAWVEHQRRSRADWEDTFAKMAQTFFGPGEHWKAEWTIGGAAQLETYTADGEGINPALRRALGL